MRVEVTKAGHLQLAERDDLERWCLAEWGPHQLAVKPRKLGWDPFKSGTSVVPQSMGEVDLNVET